MMNALVFIIYDSIHHSIFEGQVLAPLLKQLHARLYTEIHIISFEETLSPGVRAAQRKYSQIHPHITLTLFKRPRFFLQTLLWQQSFQLKKILETISSTYQLYARGPIAGLIAKQALTPNCKKLTIQARGLLAEEHAYTHRKSKGIYSFLHKLRTRQLSCLEKTAYTPFSKSYPSFHIEVVSPALQTYLMKKYSLPPAIFTFPLFDSPPPLSPTEKLSHRTTIRAKLAIPPDALVYVYNGSLKAWQCPHETIAAFKAALQQEKKSIFLALTQDKEIMHQLLKEAFISPSSYRILYVPHQEVVPYLCAADYGMLFREAHPLNWVSRPTKLLEYQAVGLQILHNNAIQLLTKKKTPLKKPPISERTFNN